MAKPYAKQKPLSQHEMKLLIETEKMERAKKCWQEVEASLKKYNCDIDAAVLVTSKGNKVDISIYAKE